MKANKEIWMLNVMLIYDPGVKPKPEKWNKVIKNIVETSGKFSIWTVNDSIVSMLNFLILVILP